MFVKTAFHLSRETVWREISLLVKFFLSLNLGFLAKTNQQYSQKCVSNVQKKSWGKKVCLKENNTKTFLAFQGNTFLRYKRKNGRVLKSVTSVSRGTFEEKWFFWNQYNTIRFSEFEPKSLRLLVKIFWKGSQNCIQHVQKYFLNSIHLFDIFSLNHFRFLGDKLSTAGL